MLVAEFTNYLKTQIVNTAFRTGAIDKNNAQSIGVYLAKTGAASEIALGGVSNTSVSILPVRILVHWSEDADLCQQKANTIYSALEGKTDFLIGARRIAFIEMLDISPVDIGRDNNNVCEMVIRLIIHYER